MLRAIDPLGLQSKTAGTDAQGPIADEPIKDEAPPPATPPRDIDLDPLPMDPVRSNTEGTGGLEQSTTYTLRPVVIVVDVDKFFDPKHYGPNGSGGTAPAPPALPESLDNGTHGQGNNGPVKPSTVLNAARGQAEAAKGMALTFGPSLGVGALRYALTLKRAGELGRAAAALEDLSPRPLSLRQMSRMISEAADSPYAYRRTVAVGMDESGSLYAGSSNGFDAGMREMADQLGIARVRGSASLHAEEELIRAADHGQIGPLRTIGTWSRSPCSDAGHMCGQQMLDRNILWVGGTGDL